MHIVGDVILFVSSKWRHLEAQNLAVFFNFYSFYNILKDQLYRIRRSEFYKWLFRSEKFTGLSRKGSQIPKPKGYINPFWRNWDFQEIPHPIPTTKREDRTLLEYIFRLIRIEGKLSFTHQHSTSQKRNKKHLHLVLCFFFYFYKLDVIFISHIISLLAIDIFHCLEVLSC